MFRGFHRPRSNFYRLPNAWFGAWRAARAARDGGRIVGPLKATEYVIKWSWDYQNFDRPVRISWHHFQYGWLQWRTDHLQAQVDAHNADPLAGQVAELTADLTEAEADAARLAGRVRELETALTGQAKTYEAEVAHLQEQITGLNRIAGSQQRKLNDLGRAQMCWGLDTPTHLCTRATLSRCENIYVMVK